MKNFNHWLNIRRFFVFDISPTHFSSSIERITYTDPSLMGTGEIAKNYEFKQTDRKRQCCVQCFTVIDSSGLIHFSNFVDTICSFVN